MQKEFLLNLNRVREQSGRIWGDGVSSLGIKVWLVLLGITGVSLGWVYGRLPPEVPLWFSRPWGEMQLGLKGWLLVLPGSILVIDIVAATGAGLIYGREKLLARMVVWGTVVIDFLLSYALIRILLLVG